MSIIADRRYLDAAVKSLVETRKRIDDKMVNAEDEDREYLFRLLKAPEDVVVVRAASRQLPFPPPPEENQ